MAKCKNCGMELGPEATCVFATYKLEMNGKELMICCERCAGNLKSPPQPVAPAPAVSVLKPQAKPAPHRKATGKAARAGKKPKKKAVREAPKKRSLPRKVKSKAANRKRRK